MVSKLFQTFVSLAHQVADYRDSFEYCVERLDRVITRLSLKELLRETRLQHQNEEMSKEFRRRHFSKLLQQSIRKWRRLASIDQNKLPRLTETNHSRLKLKTLRQMVSKTFEDQSSLFCKHKKLANLVA